MSCCPVREAGTPVAAALRATPPVADGERPARLVRIEPAMATVGTDRPFVTADGEGPVRRVRLKAFLIDPFAVTNAWYARFIARTGWVTDAERFGFSFVFKDFVPPGLGPVQAVAGAPWWRRIEGARWDQPQGPGSTADGLDDHPVTHVSARDAQAFAAWAGGRLPSEAEWEHAAKGGLAGARFPWGDAEPDDDSVLPCNIWQGRFPDLDTGADGHRGTAPVDAFAANGYGLYNMSGNVWEWCADPFRVRSLSRHARARNAQAVASDDRVTKGGSYLCHKSYCYRYRIAARNGLSSDSSAGHTSFRIVFDPEPAP
jgi:formylglycine-generating enzyme required for sulfatase activity